MIQHLAAIWIGRILRGVVSGIVTVTVPVFINEIAIKRYKTIQLGLINFFIMSGYFLAHIFRLTVPDIDLDNKTQSEIWDEVKYKYIGWRLIFSMPIILAVLLLVLFIFVFNEDIIFYGSTREDTLNSTFIDSSSDSTNDEFLNSWNIRLANATIWSN